MKRFYFLLLIISTLSCSDSIDTEYNNLVNTWELTEINNKPVIDLTNITLAFKDNRWDFKAANRGYGTYELLENNHIQMDLKSKTLEDIILVLEDGTQLFFTDLEDEFLTTLKASKSYQFKNENLLIQSEKGNLKFKISNNSITE
jgi:heat shock protein HslJ